MHYFFDVSLPYSLQIPLSEEVDFNFEDIDGKITHLERICTSTHYGIELAAELHVPSDAFGLYFRSKIRVILSSDAVAALLALEDEQTQRLFDVDSYVALKFGSGRSTLYSYVVGAINKFLRLYRVISQEWHAVQVQPKDLVGFELFRNFNGSVIFLSKLSDTRRIFSSKNEQFGEEQIRILKQAVEHPAELDPLHFVEADIHAKAAQGDYSAACILIALMTEEAVKSHLLCYLIGVCGMDIHEARLQFIRENGHHLSIAELVDQPRKSKESCYMEKLIGWRPFLDDPYISWRRDTRELRNEILHAGRNRISITDAEASWNAAWEFLLLCRREVTLDAISKKGATVSERLFNKMFVPISPRLLPHNLIS